MPTVGELIVRLSADTASFSKDLNRANNLAFDSAKGIERSMEKIGTAAASAFGVAGGALAAMTIASARGATELLKTSQQIGISVDALSGLKFAAQESQTSFEALVKGAGLLAKNMAMVAEGVATKGGAAEAFKVLGLEVRNADGTLKSTDEMLLGVADKFHSMADGTLKTGLAMQIFGRAGKEMIPFLNQGRAGIEELKKEAAELGVVMDKQTAQQALVLTNDLKKLTDGLEGVGNAVLRQVLPVLLPFADGMVQAAKDGVALLNSTNALRTSMFTFAYSLIDVNRLLNDLAADALLARNAIDPRSPLTGMWDQYVNHLRMNKTEAEALKSMLDADVLSAAANAGRGLKVGGLELDLSKMDADKKALDKLVAGLQKQWDVLGLNSTALKIYETTMLGATDAVKWHVLALQNAIDGETRYLKAVKDAQDFAWTKLSATTPWDASQKLLDAKVAAINFEKEMEAINAATLAVTLQAKDASEVFLGWPQAIQLVEPKLLDLAKAMQKFGEQSASAFRSAILHGQNFSQALKAILVDLAQLILKMIFFKSISGMIDQGGATGFFGSFLKGLIGFAGGGSVMGGQPVVVGESGPELFVPGSSGTVVPNNALRAGGGPTIINQFDFRGTDASAIPRIQQAAKDIEDRAVARSVGTFRELQLRTA